MWRLCRGWHESNFAEIFGVIKLESVDYLVVLFVLSYTDLWRTDTGPWLVLQMHSIAGKNSWIDGDAIGGGTHVSPRNIAVGSRALQEGALWGTVYLQMRHCTLFSVYCMLQIGSTAIFLLVFPTRPAWLELKQYTAACRHTESVSYHHHQHIDRWWRWQTPSNDGGVRTEYAVLCFCH